MRPRHKTTGAFAESTRKPLRRHTETSVLKYRLVCVDTQKKGSYLDCRRTEMLNVFSSDFEDRWGTEGEVRIGWASWDKGDHKSASVKWAYPDTNGKVSRGSPEVPIDVLVEMVKQVIAHESFFPEGDREAVQKLKSVLSS